MITFTAEPVFVAATAFQIIGRFLLLTTCSILIGIAYGLIASLIFKYFRFVTVSAIKETLVIFSFGYLSYCTAEVLHFSGIIAMLTSGVIMAHYAWYSLSPQGKTVSSVTIQSIGFGFEAFVFAYLGLSFFSFYEYEWSWQFILVEVVIIIVGRFIGTVGLIYFMSIFGHKKDVTFRELIFISYSGMIRGAIAFGLALRLDETILPNSQALQTTVLTLVIFTTIVFGSLMPLV